MNPLHPIYQADLGCALEGLGSLSAIKNSTVMITGASGMVGACLTDLLGCANERLGLNLTVFVSIKTSQHNEKWTQSLINAVMALPNVVEFHRMAGDIDYLLKVVVEDMAAYDRFYRRLIGAVDLLDVSASFSMEVIKSTTELPLDAL